MSRVPLLALFIIVSLPLFAQTGNSPSTPAANNAKPLTFDVVSVKPDQSGAGMSNMKILPDGVRLLNVSPATVIREGYLLEYDEHLENLPQWATSEHYDIVANVGASDVAECIYIDRIDRPTEN